MKTLLLTLEYPPFKGGIANYYGNLAHYWPLGESLSVMDNNRGELMRDKKFLSWLNMIPSIARKIDNGKIDYTLVGHILPLGTVVWLISLIRPLKYAVFLHGMDFSYALRKKRKQFLSGMILSRADKIICANNYVAEKVKEIWPRQGHKTEVINPGVPAGVPNPDAAAIASLKSKYKLTGKTVLLTIGRLVKRKGMDKTIEALEALPEKLVDNLSYFIIGSGSAEGYLRELIPGKLSSKVTFLGELTADEKWDWLNLSDILIMPSRDIAGDFEGFGIVYLEANLCGKPVIAGDSGGVRDAVIDGYNGILVNPNDTAGIGQAIIKLALDSELRNKLGAQGKERTIKEFNWERQVEKLFKIIKG